MAQPESTARGYYVTLREVRRIAALRARRSELEAALANPRDEFDEAISLETLCRERLYRLDFRTFADYLAWLGVGRTRAYRLIRTVF